MECFASRAAGALPLFALNGKEYGAWLKRQPALVRHALADFKPEAGSFRRLPDARGKLNRALVIIHDTPQLWDLAALPLGLPEGTYKLVTALPPDAATLLSLGWALGSYQFTRYRKPPRAAAKLVWPEGADKTAVLAQATAIARGRDLITTPAEDMGPAELVAAVQEVGKAHKARARLILGDTLLKENFPLVHVVGRASSRAPRLVELRWGETKHPRVTLVGKGVCFDTGGLDIKPSSGMLLMKKDMGGAASALAAAEMVMAAKLPVQLRLLIPAVENAISGNAFRPSDVFKARNGMTVEIGNTDAEGRLILADALAAAAEEKPDLLLDFATLTGAARTALGTELPALFCNDDDLATKILAAGKTAHDPLWRLPLEESYKSLLQTRIADINSAPGTPYAGAITAALFLQYFAGKTRWAHIDMMGWHLGSKPGRPEGGEPMAARAVFALIKEMYG